MNDFWPVFKEVKADIDRIEQVQAARHCLAHEVQISTLERSDNNQWKEINKLKRLVYIGVGVSACIGSIVGNLLLDYIKR